MEQRVPTYRPSTRSIKPPSRKAIFFILIFFLGVLFVLFLESPLGEIKKIRVTGNEWVPDQELLEKSRLAKGSSYFRWDASEAQKRLRRLPEIREVKVTKSFPGEVHIQVWEKDRVGYWLDDKKMHPVLADGTVLTDRLWTGSVDRPLLKGWSRRELKDALISGLARTPKKVLADISEIRPGKDESYPDLVKAYTRQGHVVRVRAGDFGRKMKYYSAFRNHPPGTLNLLESTWFVPENNESG
ncbi:cell division protein FtsQ/DivIB [Paludifilum halophilum]|nr:FtsQ-type POTRA domain-containing protein [Paludifilum halophilum]